MPDRNSMAAGGDNYTVHVMAREDVDMVIEWALAQGWNQGPNDARCYYAADPTGFLLGRLDGEPIGCISAVKYGDRFAHLGMYLVRTEYRGRGYGLRLWQAAMAGLEGRVVGLDGDMHQVANYEKSGFHTVYYDQRYRGVATGPCDVDDPRIVPLDDVPFEQVLAYDIVQLPAPRPDFLRCWIGQPGHVALGAVQDGRLVGYSVVRPGRVGFRVGPLFADDESVAEALFRAVAGRLPAGSPLFLDVPEERENPAATMLALRHGMTQVSHAAHMLYPATAEVHVPLHHWFGITCYAMG